MNCAKFRDQCDRLNCKGKMRGIFEVENFATKTLRNI
jgi:hypothetical protein